MLKAAFAGHLEVIDAALIGDGPPPPGGSIIMCRDRRTGTSDGRPGREREAAAGGVRIPEGYAYLRQELRFEHTLLGSRMTYYMTSQSFLFTAAAIARATQWHWVYWFSGVLLPLIGVIVSAVLLLSIHAAYERMDQWRAKERLFEGKHALVVLYPEDKHRTSLLFTTLMPWLFIGVWATVAVLIHTFRPQAGGM